MVEVQKYPLSLKLLGDLHLVRNTTSETSESTPGLLFRCGENIPNKFTNECDALIHVLGYLESFGTPEPDNILGKKCSPTVALLKCGDLSLENGHN